MSLEKLNLTGENKSDKVVDVKSDLVDSVAAESASNLAESVDLNAKVSESSKRGPSDNNFASKKSTNVTSINNFSSSKSMPTNPETLKSEIKEAIENEIAHLHEKIKKLQVAKDYSEISNSVKQIRSLSSMLKDLIRASFETMKDMWMKFVGNKK